MMNRRRRSLARKQQGFLLIALMALLTMGVLYFIAVQLEAVGLYQREALKSGSGNSMVQARDALLGYAATYRDNNANEVFGYLPCPDTTGDGIADTVLNSTQCGSSGQASIGLLPYRTLGLPDLRDNEGNCLWYAVSGSFKAATTKPTPINWDTQGQFSVIDANGTVLIAPNDSQGGAAAVIFAAGAPLTGQSRSPSANAPCNIDPTQVAGFLDGSYSFATASTITLAQGQVKDASGTVTNNDRLAWITPKDIFDRVIKRQDFSNALTATPAGQINTLADRIRAALELRIQNDIFGGTSTSVPTNTASYNPKPPGIYVGEVDPAMDIGVANQPSYANYLTNWAEQFRQAICDNLSSPCLDINNSGTANCRGALMLGGRQASGQPRASTQKGSSLSILANYFESGSGTGGLDLLTGLGRFVGNTAFTSASQAADTATCLGYGRFVSLKTDAAQFASGTVTPGGGGSAVAAVTGGASPEIVLGSATANSRAGCVWYPVPLPIESSLRVYFKYRIDSATTGSTARGYALALADAATNNPYRTNPLMCGANSSTRLGYAGAPVSGTATVWGTTQTISATSWSYSTGRATITTAVPHWFFPGNTVTIAGAYPTGYNGTYTIASTSGFPSTSFTYSVPYPGSPLAGIAPPKIGVEFDTNVDSSRNDPSAEHFAFLYWGSAGDNNMTAASTTRDGSDDNSHGDGVTGDGGQPLNPRNLTTTSATATALANIASARWTGGTATITTSAPHGFSNGQRIVVSDTSPLGYKGTYTTTVIDATHFTYPLTANPGAYPHVATLGAATWAGGVATITTSAAHGLSTGQSVTVSNVSPSAWNGSYVVTMIDATHFSYPLASNPGAYVSGGQVSYPLSWVNAASWSGGIVTMTTAGAHNLVSNQYVTITGILPSGYNGTYRVTVTDSTHFTYALVNPATNPGAYVSGGLVAIAGITSTVMAGTTINITGTTWSTGGTATVITAAAHGLGIGQTVYVSGVAPTGYNGVYAVASVPSSTSFTFGLANAGLAVGSGGLVATAAPTTATMSSAAWSSANGGTATLATVAAHGFTNGQIVNIGGISPGGYNGAYAITIPSISNASWAAGTITIETSQPHGLRNGQTVIVGGVTPAGYNGAFSVANVFDATHLSVALVANPGSYVTGGQLTNAFQYALATNPGDEFNAATFATPGIATVKSSDLLLPYNGTMPLDTDIHVRLDVGRSYDASKHQATLTLRAYIGDNFSTGNCELADFQNFARDLSALCPIRTPTIEQNGIVVNDVAGPALQNIYFGYSTTRGSSASDNETIHVRNLILRSQ